MWVNAVTSMANKHWGPWGQSRPRARGGKRTAPECQGSWGFGRGAVSLPQNGGLGYNPRKILNYKSVHVDAFLRQPLRQIISTISALYTIMKTTHKLWGYTRYSVPSWPNVARSASLSECVGFTVPLNTQQVILETSLSRQSIALVLTTVNQT